MRSLIADLGDAYCEELRRTRIGPFDVADADPERVVELDEALAFMPEVRLTGEDARRAGHGAAVPAGEALRRERGSRPADRRARADRAGRAARGRALLKPIVGLRGSEPRVRRLPRRCRSRCSPRAEPRPRRVAVGEFDGVHLGHREVIAGSDTVLTFEPHPLAVVRPEAAPKLLTSLEAKAELIASLGVEELVVIPFDDGVRPPDARGVHRPRAGGAAAARRGCRSARTSASATAPPATPACCAADGRFETRVVPLVEVDGEIVSSSHIRGLVLAGEVELAARFLGAPFQLRGEVVRGDQRGRELGFPTANIVPDEELVCPGHGVYAARADGDCAAVSIGVRPTFGTGRAVLVEAFLLDRDVDLYGKILRIDFLARLRGERRFDSVDALIEQMQPRRRADARELCRRARSGSRRPASLSGRMTLTQERKQELIDEVRRRPDDTGKAEVQVALMTERINDLNRAPAHPPQGSPLAPRAADAGRPPPQAAQLPPAF